MNRTLLSALLVTVAMPMAAIAQTDDAAPTGTEEPATETQAPADPAQDEPAGDEAAPADEAAPTDEGTSEDGASMDEEAAPGSDTGDEPAATDDAGSMSEEPADDAAGTTGGSTDTQSATDSAESGDDAATLAGEDDVEGPFVTVPQTGAWRVSDLEGKSVEDANGESIGDISDVLVNEKGEVIAVLVGVGGFLGIGEKDVAVAMSALEFGPGKTEGLRTEEEAAAEQAPAAGTGGMAGGTGGMTTTAPATTTPAPAEPEEPVVGQDNLPNRIVLNVTREELEAAPAYEDVEEGTAGEAAPDAATEAPAE